MEAQATDRAFRIGQAKNVFVHRLITKVRPLVKGREGLPTRFPELHNPLQWPYWRQLCRH